MSEIAIKEDIEFINKLEALQTADGIFFIQPFQVFVNILTENQNKNNNNTMYCYRLSAVHLTFLFKY